MKTKSTHPTNCKNCGAVLHGNICEYCGTEYSVSNNAQTTTSPTNCSYEIYRETVHCLADEYHLDPKQMLDDFREMPYVRWNPSTLFFSVPNDIRIEFRGKDLLIYQKELKNGL